MIPLYILGLLLRYGAQHGYQIKKTISEELSDFTQIKLPTIYYHLEKMQSEGLLEAMQEKDSNRPEKTVYAITQKGKETFDTKLNALLKFEYRPAFASDAVFYFSDSLEKTQIAEHLEFYVRELKGIIAAIQKHEQETMRFVPDNMKTIVRIVFDHHLLHYRAELAWAEQSHKEILKEA